MATYYWVGGNGTWDNASKTNWATSSGGAGGFGPPLSTDTVIFDSLSGTGTCTTATGSACATATLNSSTLGLTLGANHTMSGTFTLTLGTLSLGGNTLSCNVFSSSNSNSRTIQFGTGNITLTGNAAVIWNSATSTNFATSGTKIVNCSYSGSTGTRTISTGTGLNENNCVSFNITAGSDIIGPIGVTKSLDFTGFTGTYSQSSTQLVLFENITFSSGMTITGGTGILYFYSASVTQKLTTNGKTIDCPIYVGFSTTQIPTVVCQDALTQGSTRAFTFANGTLQLKDGVTSTVGTFSTSGTAQKYLQSTVAGSQATLSQASGKVNATYLTVKDIAATGSATWFGTTKCVTQGNNSGWCFTPQLGKPIPSFAF